MLIKFDVSIEKLSNINASERSNILSEFIRASRIGTHRVVIPRRTVDWVSDNVNLSHIDLAHLRRLRSEYTQLAGQMRQATFAMVVTDEGDISFFNSSFNAGRFVSIGYRNVISKGYLQNPIFLAENASNDGAILGLIIKHEARRRSFGALSYDFAHGGGDGVADELERYVGLGRVVACVCDTDMKVPNGKRSNTYNKVMNAVSQLPLVGFATGTPGSEIENFIPLNIIDDMYRRGQEKTVDRLISIMEKQGPCESGNCFWLYFDLKRGTDGMVNDWNTPEKKAWAIDKIGKQEDAGSCIKVEGFGENIVRDFLASPELLHIFFQFSRSEYWALHFSPWIERILWVICGRAELRTG